MRKLEPSKKSRKIIANTDITITKEEVYKRLIDQLAVFQKEDTSYSSGAELSYAAALLMSFLQEVNWVGFYMSKHGYEDLILTSYQGAPACPRIPKGEGACGLAYSRKESTIIGDVNEFSQHIIYRDITKSEIIVPIYYQGEIDGVLCINSPAKNRFDNVDSMWLEKFLSRLMSD